MHACPVALAASPPPTCVDAQDGDATPQTAADLVHGRGGVEVQTQAHLQLGLGRRALLRGQAPLRAHLRTRQAAAAGT